MDKKVLDEHFRYYQENEQQFVDTERYAFVSKKCKDTYSLVYANILFNICSDFESLIRAYFGKENDDPMEINEIIGLIESDSILIKAFDESVSFRSADYEVFQPLVVTVDNRNNKKSFKWWSAYNMVKHNKVAKIFHAKQGNVLNALAGLYIMNRYILNAIIAEGDVDIFPNDKQFFRLSNLKTKTVSLASAVAHIVS